ncbi:hypothetical protein [Phytobacter sp. V91]|uniref:hypothetical protein n=1 Tax=Phytobacter sp. V91 TaxID=3369425 RepID=UPI003F5EAD76
MMNMGFFTTDYRYDLPESKPVWQAAEAFIQSVKPLKTLRAEALRYLQSLMQATHKGALKPGDQDIPPDLKKAYVQAFRDPKMVGDYSREFWLARTGLDKNAAGALYRVLDEHRGDMPVARAFALALQQAEKMPEVDNNQRQRLQHICDAEPFLALIDLMFSGLRRQSSQTLAEFSQFWHARGLTARSLSDLAAQLQSNRALLDSLSGTPKARFEHLLRLAAVHTLDGQVQGLLNYHCELMAMRGQFPWLTLVNDKLTLQVPPATLDENRQNSDWVNNYYLPHFRHLLNGLWGNAA